MDGPDACGAGVKSGDHHHGEAETAIYVLSGNPVFVFAEGGREIRLETEPGDYIFVPPYVPHREENPGDQEAVVIIARSSQEGIVVNLDSLWPGGGVARGTVPDETVVGRHRQVFGPWAYLFLICPGHNLLIQSR